jgi:DNA-binding CsgD family transcriptional regulator
MDDRKSLSRLTEREKVCLRQWLQHKSAKEIAADLGISHHAVEKRLKMARTKLGATSSLAAARMLGESEGYGQAVTQSPDLVSDALPLHPLFTRLAILGVVIMILFGAIVLGLLLQPATSQAPNNQPVGPGERAVTTASVPTPGTEAALRRLVAGLASGSPDYAKLAPQFAEVVRRDLPMTHPMFKSMGELKSVTFRGRGAMGDDIYNLVFANGGVKMSAALDADGRMAGGILQPVGPGEPVATPGSVPTAGTEAVLRRLVAGLASGSPDYGKLSPQFAEVVRRDLPMTQPLFSSMGELKSVTFRGRGAMGDDVYNLLFANGGVTMSAALDADGRMVGGILRPEGPPRR